MTKAEIDKYLADGNPYFTIKDVVCGRSGDITIELTSNLYGTSNIIAYRHGIKGFVIAGTGIILKKPVEKFLLHRVTEYLSSKIDFLQRDLMAIKEIDNGING